METNTNAMKCNRAGGAVWRALALVAVGALATTAWAVPANDDCDQAIEIPVISGVPFNPPLLNTTTATNDSCEFFGCSPGQFSVWYVFDAPAGGVISVDTNGSSYDTVMAIFSACPVDPDGSGPQTCPSNILLACDNDSGAGNASSIQLFEVEGGQAYYIGVQGAGSPGSGGMLDFNFVYDNLEPENDQCSAATVITSNEFDPPPLNTAFASGQICEPQESCAPGGPSQHSVWYQFTPTQNGLATIDTFGSNYDTVLSIFTGCGFFNPATFQCVVPAQVACNNNFGAFPSSKLENVPLTTGTTYRIKVAAAAGTMGGNLDFNFSFVPSGGAAVTIVSANPPLDNPYVAGQQPFRDVLDTGSGAALTAGIGGPGTAAQGTVNYVPISVTFSGTPVPAPSLANITVACTGGPCPSVTTLGGSGAGPYSIGLSGPIPPGQCTTLTFAGTQSPGGGLPGSLSYQSQPGNVDMNGTTNTQDLLALIQALNNGAANQPANLARYNVNRSAGANPVNTQDVLRVIQLLNGTLTTQAFNGATVAACP